MYNKNLARLCTTPAFFSVFFYWNALNILATVVCNSSFFNQSTMVPALVENSCILLVFKYRKDITVLIILFWFNIAHYSSTFFDQLYIVLYST